MTPQIMQRGKASLTHLGISAASIILIVGSVALVWYPSPLLRAVGGHELIAILFAVDVVLGPLITLVIFDRRKKYLAWDIGVVVGVQVCALIYGLSVLYAARPVFVVHVIDRLEVVRAADLDTEDIALGRFPEFQSLPMWGPKLISVKAPKEENEKFALLELAVAGKDMHLLPRLYVAYDAEQKKVAITHAKPISRLRELNQGRAASLDSAIGSLGRGEFDLAFLPLKARQGDMSAIIDRGTGDILVYLDFVPW